MITKKWVTKKCLACKREFSSYVSEERKYCSPKCRGIGRRVKKPPCIVCGSSLPLRKGNKKYCSLKCRTKDWTGKKKPHTWNIEKRECKFCGKAFTVGGRYADKIHKDALFCSNECSSKSQRITIDEFWVNGGKTSSKNWEEYREKILKRDGYKCVFCGISRNLQIHHMLPREYGGSHTKGNLVACCRHCHGSIDRVIRLIANNDPDNQKEVINKMMQLIGKQKT